MGRPREHDERVRVALLDAAERMVEERGPDGLSIRAVADEIGTTTRAVYSLFGSKARLLTALATEAFTLLIDVVEGTPVTGDPVADLIDAGAVRYRRFVRRHPSIYRLAFHRISTEVAIDQAFYDARAKAWAPLEARMQRVDDAGKLRLRSVREAAVEFNALCEGLANAELRGGTVLDVPERDKEGVWRRAFESLFAGLASSPKQRRKG